jgi:hypothetical protein
MEDLEHHIAARWKKLNGDSRKYPTRNEKCLRELIFSASLLRHRTDTGMN